METKVCSKCGQSIPVSEFYKSKNTKDGYQPYCKPCYKANATSNYYKKRDYYLGKAKEHGGKDSTRQEAKKRRKDYAVEWYEFLSSLVELKCIMCGYNKCLSALDFHHIDPSTKEYEVSRITKGRMRTPEREQLVADEVSKCVVLCANCHREHHSKGKYD